MRPKSNLLFTQAKDNAQQFFFCAIHQAFSVLTEAKKEDERKRATLLDFYERTDVCLQNMDGKVDALLEQNIGNLKEKIAFRKQNLLKKEYIVLVAGLL